jgi:asparagine synthase (glutamine-hydrolysing)
VSGLFVSHADLASATSASERLSFTKDTRRWVGDAGDVTFAVTRVDQPELWSPARDSQTGVQILLGGRVAFEESDWQRSETLPYEGGLAPRLLLQRWLRSPDEFAEGVNGAFGIVIHDPRDQTLHVFTDRLGVFPFYRAENSPLALCSHPDVLADWLRDEKLACDFDLTTLGEFIATGSATQPFTYYRQIQQLEAASHYRWDLRPEPKLAARAIYWRPRYLVEETATDFEAAAEALSGAITKAVRRRTLPRLGRPLVLLSGGADSRCALFAANDPSKVVGFTLFDEPNEELSTARALAEASGATHHAEKRSPDYYGDNAEQSVRVSGGMWSVVDAHYTGATGAMRALQPGTVLTGCYADYMFKGLSLNRRYRTLFGRDLPLFKFAPFQKQYYQPHIPLAPTWQKSVDARFDERFPVSLRKSDGKPRLGIEDLRLRPLSREPDCCGRLFLWRTMPWDPLLSDSDIVEVYGRFSPQMKLNGIVFGKAVGQVIGPSGRRIPNNNYGTPVDASELARAAWFLWAVLMRKVRRVTGREPTGSRLATSGSWPDWGYYVSNSAALSRLWSEPKSSERELFTGILGRDPWQTTVAEWGKTNATLFMRLLSARIWLRQRGIAN